jgi:hypothetical protein
MLERTEERFGLKPQRLAGDTAYGAAPMLNWLVEEKQIAPHIPVFDRSKREDGTFSREHFCYDEASDTYACPAGKPMTTTGRINAGDAIFYRSSLVDCAKCDLKPRCSPKSPFRRSRAASTSAPVRWLGRGSAPRPSSSRAANASASR